MEKEYDFSKGIKGKFYIPKEEIELPIYLDKTNQEFYQKLATENNIGMSQLINRFLAKEKDFISTYLKTIQSQ